MHRGTHQGNPHRQLVHVTLEWQAPSPHNGDGLLTASWTPWPVLNAMLPDCDTACTASSCTTPVNLNFPRCYLTFKCFPKTLVLKGLAESLWH